MVLLDVRVEVHQVLWHLLHVITSRDSKQLQTHKQDRKGKERKPRDSKKEEQLRKCTRSCHQELAQYA